MTRQDASAAIGQLITDKTNGRPYVFVIMSYQERYDLFERVRQIAASLGLACLRADDVEGSGQDLLHKVHLLIERAEIVVAEISDPSPNVFYEVGYAVALQKPPILLIEQGKDVPTDLRGREVIRHGGSKELLLQFDSQVRQHFEVRVNARTGLLHDLLVADSPSPVYVVANPKYPRESRIRGQVFDRRTFSDNLGIRGLITAFGSLLGEGAAIELVSGGYLPPDFLTDRQPRNLYVIGSKKTNAIAGDLLQLVQGDREPSWYLGAESPDQERGDYQVHLYRTAGGNRDELKSETEKVLFPDGKPGIVHHVDHGLIVRGPHPYHPDRLVVLLAGPHSLGTAAACVAATRSHYVRQIRERLPRDIDLADKTQPFWVLVRGVASKHDKLLDEDAVEVLEAGGYATAARPTPRRKTSPARRGRR